MEAADSVGEQTKESGAPRSPSLSLPKGGGAVRGMGEKFAANPVTGTGFLTVPVFATPGRSGFGPKLALNYDSGTGNSAFGFGWDLSLPAITRKTDKGLPTYRDPDEADTFLLPGAEDLVPVLEAGPGGWVRAAPSSRVVFGRQYAIHAYRPRVEGLFARIERWRNVADATDTFWRSISRDNLATWYGKTAESRIADPEDASRVFSWLVCESHDDKGNLVVYRYKPEDAAGVELSASHERNRTDLSRSAQRYVKTICYGNRTPYFPDLVAAQAVAVPEDWCFQLVFDYGEHDLAAPVPSDAAATWNCRLDPFSSCRARFDIRTYRLCRRILMFHHFADQPAVGVDCLVRSTELVHASASPTDASQPFYSTLLSATQVGHVRLGDGYLSRALPPVEFEYTQATIDETVRDIDPDSLRNLPDGLSNVRSRWVDLDGEGVPGVLAEQGQAWYYKPNLSPANIETVDGKPLVAPRFGALQRVGRQPSSDGLASGNVQLMDLAGDGRLSAVAFDGPCAGYFERTEDADWAPFRAFGSVAHVDWRGPNLRFVDLTGDGFSDLLIGEDAAFCWHPSLGAGGFGPGQRVAQSLDEEKGPKLVFGDSTETIFLADMSGDGLTDLVRIRNGEACYWPNRGYGRFGAKVTMDGAPRLDRADLFDGRRIRLADIDGSGTADLIYFANDAVRLYFNQSGNDWGSERRLTRLPAVESVSSATVVDLLGNGTACLVWSSPLPGAARRPMRYIDLMGGQKPHLLVRSRNNLGAETVVRYAPSTRFSVADKLAGTPWLTRLPFPVHVVERVETWDWVSRNRFVSRYAYHHGHYDGVEREFRGFGRVEQWDTEDYGAASAAGDFPQGDNENATSLTPPVRTVSWFHTGAWMGESVVSRQFDDEYYGEGDTSDANAGLAQAQRGAMRLDDTRLPGTVLSVDGTRTAVVLSPQEQREACRALRGSLLRREVYGLDGTDRADRPYVAMERNYTLEMLQPRGPNRHAVFFAHSRENVDFQYERALWPVSGGAIVDPAVAAPGTALAADPRVSHAITLATDAFGNVLESVSIAYGRRFRDPALTPTDQARQSALQATGVSATFTNAVLTDDAWRAPLAAESNIFELIQWAPGVGQAGVTHLLRFDELSARRAIASDGAHDLAFEQSAPTVLVPGDPYRRLVGRTRTYRRPDDMGAAASEPRALLPLARLESRALPGVAYRLAMTPGLVASVYRRSGNALLPTPVDVLGSTAADCGGYVDVDSDGHWWIPSPRAWLATSTVAPSDELAEATAHFFMPRRFEDAFGNVSTVDYDTPNDLVVVSTVDAVGNTASAVIDYRVLAPSQVTDANGNRSVVAFDALGQAAGSAVMGKVTEDAGDSLAGFVADLDPAQVAAFFAAADPHALAADLLGGASMRVVQDLQRFRDSRLAAPDEPAQWRPVVAATLVRETHVSDLATGASSRIQIAFGHSDGIGREIQRKLQSEPGPTPLRDASGAITIGPDGQPEMTGTDTDLRWVGSGWTVYDNKGQAVRQFEPFFTDTHAFEFDVRIGVSPVLLHDPLGRLVATLQPDHSVEKVVFDPWRKQTWDGNDCVLLDPAIDADLSAWCARLDAAEFTPTWHALRTDTACASLAALRWPEPHQLTAQRDAAEKAAAHAATPTTTHFDALGRTFLTLADNGADGIHATRIDLDIQGRQRSVNDALGRQVTQYEHDLLGVRIHLASMEAGQRWMLADVVGNPVRAWDSRGHDWRTERDRLRRPTGLFVKGTDAGHSDPRTLAAELAVQTVEYGDSQPASLNLRTRVFRTGDSAGLVTNVGHDPTSGNDVGCDFKGNVLRSSRGVFADYQDLPDLRPPPPAQEVFAISTQYDALNRVIASTTPDGSVVRNIYNSAGQLGRVVANLQGAAQATSFIANIDYDAKSRRSLVAYGNGARTASTYDRETSRLTRLTTTRSGWPADQRVVQDLSYANDPVGNITHIQDDADLQNVVYFRNQRVEPSNDYRYDATYRLVTASGREHLGLDAGGVALRPAAGSYNDAPRAGLPSPNDGHAMGTWVEQYEYDAVGNLTTLTHRGSQPAHPGWSRSYEYAEPSQLEPAKAGNRLTSTSLGGANGIERYVHDLHGNMTAMPQLQLMRWNFDDKLAMTQRQAVNADDEDGTLHQGERTWYVYDAGGRRSRKVTVRQNGTRLRERLYIGGFEIHREYGGDGNTVSLQRETLIVSDADGPAAVVDTRTQGTEDAPARGIRFQFGNHLGSVSLELDAAAQLVSYEEYYPYGGTSYQAGRSMVEISAKRFRYTGMERDSESGLSYHAARYYAPWLGRWTSCDPLGVASDIDLYRYCRDCPLGWTDTSGLQPAVDDPAPVSYAGDDNDDDTACQQATTCDGSEPDLLPSPPPPPPPMLGPPAPPAKSATVTAAPDAGPVRDTDPRAFLAEHPEFDVLPPSSASAAAAQQSSVAGDDYSDRVSRPSSPEVLMVSECNTSGGLACHAGLIYVDTPDFSHKMLSGEVSVGSWDVLDMNGQPDATRYGVKVDVNTFYFRFGNPSKNSFDIYAPRASAEASAGPDGFSLSASASVVGGDVTVGSGPDPESRADAYAHVGLSLGFSLGARMHYGDIDNDGAPEIGAGIDVGPVSADVEVEIPVPRDTLQSISNIGTGGLWGGVAR